MKVVVGVDESLGHRSIGVSRFASGSSFAGGRASGRLPATRKFGAQGRACCIAALDCGEDGSGFREALDSFRPEVVVHLAAHYVAEHAYEDIGVLVRSNVLFGAYLLEAMREVGCDAMVYAGTSWQHYRDQEYCPVNLYAAMKQAFSTLAEFYRDAAGLRLLELHLYDSYGENDLRKS